MSRMQPLRLEWTLASPMVAGAHPLHLDALVAYAVTQRAMQDGTAAGRSFDELASELPLQRAGEADEWCWQASALDIAAGPYSMRLWTRKTDEMDYARRMERQQIDVRLKFPLKRFAGKIDTSRGIFKEHFKFFQVRQVHRVQAWCVGDAEALGELLDPAAGLVTALGAKVRMGFGRVLTFEMHEDEEGLVQWRRRVLPWPEAGSVPVRMAVRPPYWHGDNVRDAFAMPELFA